MYIASSYVPSLSWSVPWSYEIEVASVSNNLDWRIKDISEKLISARQAVWNLICNSIFLQSPTKEQYPGHEPSEKSLRQQPTPRYTSYHYVNFHVSPIYKCLCLMFKLLVKVVLSRGPLNDSARLDKLAIFFRIRRKRHAFYPFLFSLLKIPSYERCVFRNFTAATVGQLTSYKRDPFDQMRIHTKLKTSFS
jgi:hypothetical protein